jgi:branched-chain amino acid transport system ATP-binding protein
VSLLVLDQFTVARNGRPVVRDVNLSIPPGEVTALLGPNGAGKSSLVLGRRPEKIRRAGVAVVPEGRRLLSELTVEDNIEVACYALSREEANAGREWALELFPELRQRLDTSARSLSGGEQQMLVLAQALVSKPKVILIDELSLGLAPVVIKRLIPTISTVAESGVGVLLIEQFATVALGLANQVHVMDRGSIELSATAKELKENPDLLHSSYLLGGKLEAAG